MGTQTWNNTARVVEVSGPDECYVRDTKRQIGQPVGPVLLGILRSGSEVQVFWGVYVDDLIYLGTAEGDRFTARASLDGWGWGCLGGGGDVLERIEAELSGRLTADGRQLTATEIVTYHFRSGVMKVVSEWAASRID